jgi:periodic tryptophan protein 1
MLSSICWVPRGAAKEFPDKYELSKAELEALEKQAAEMTLDLDDADGNADGNTDNKEDSSMAQANAAAAAAAHTAGARSSKAKKSSSMSEDRSNNPHAARMAVEEQFLKEIGMDQYDDDEDSSDDEDARRRRAAALLLKGAAATTFASNEEDPYMTIPDEEDSEEEEDNYIRQSDSVICIGRTQDEASFIDMYIYDEKEVSLFVHHDIPIPAFPLAVEWLNCRPDQSGEKGSYLAVGTFKAGIEIWNLDVIDVMEPVATLGGRDPNNKLKIDDDGKKKKKNKKKKNKKRNNPNPDDPAMQDALFGQLRPGSHHDAVMSLSWHKSIRPRLASGSADNTIKVWDVRSQQCMSTFKSHKGKVQALEWNPTETNLLLSAGYDRRAVITDEKSGNKLTTVHLDAEAEDCAWNPFAPFMFLVSTETGCVVAYDARKSSAGPLFTLAAHDKPTTAISMSRHIPGLLATASLDQTVKTWDFRNNTPTLLSAKNMEVGKLFCMDFDIDAPMTLAAGGDKGKIAIWDTTGDEHTSTRFKDSLQQYHAKQLGV